MEGFLYDDDLENDRKNVSRLALTEESINRTLLNDGENKKSLCKNTSGCLIYIIAGSIICMVIVVVILVIKHSL